MGSFNIDYPLFLRPAMEKDRRGEGTGSFLFLRLCDGICDSSGPVSPDLFSDGAFKMPVFNGLSSLYAVSFAVFHTLCVSWKKEHLP